MTGRAGAFVLQGVIPGDYILSIDKTEWCWSDNTVDVTVDDRDVADISLQHTGYLLRVQSSHPLTLVILIYYIIYNVYIYVNIYIILLLSIKV